jgi:hypothetical protein
MIDDVPENWQKFCIAFDRGRCRGNHCIKKAPEKANLDGGQTKRRAAPDYRFRHEGIIELMASCCGKQPYCFKTLKPEGGEGEVKLMEVGRGVYASDPFQRLTCRI